jgi:hypothetical protein
MNNTAEKSRHIPPLDISIISPVINPIKDKVTPTPIAINTAIDTIL